MITRKEAEAYEKEARADERLAAAEKKMFNALSTALRVPKQRPASSDQPPILPRKAAQKGTSKKK
jgi:hypothetical protein